MAVSKEFKCVSLKSERERRERRLDWDGKRLCGLRVFFYFLFYFLLLFYFNYYLLVVGLYKAAVSAVEGEGEEAGRADERNGSDGKMESEE